MKSISKDLKKEQNKKVILDKKIGRINKPLNVKKILTVIIVGIILVVFWLI